jgi:hypothetical protein
MMADNNHSEPVVDRRTDPVLPPTTTREEDRHSAGQRDINRTWEYTQRLIALSVTWVSLSVAAWLAIMGATESVQTAALVFVFGVANLVIGFYFGRTNHQRVGGVQEGR